MIGFSKANASFTVLMVLVEIGKEKRYNVLHSLIETLLNYERGISFKPLKLMIPTDILKEMI